MSVRPGDVCSPVTLCPHRHTSNHEPVVPKDDERRRAGTKPQALVAQHTRRGPHEPLGRARAARTQGRRGEAHSLDADLRASFVERTRSRRARPWRSEGRIRTSTCDRYDARRRSAGRVERTCGRRENHVSLHLGERGGESRSRLPVSTRAFATNPPRSSRTVTVSFASEPWREHRRPRRDNNSSSKDSPFICAGPMKVTAGAQRQTARAASRCGSCLRPQPSRPPRSGRRHGERLSRKLLQWLE